MGCALWVVLGEDCPNYGELSTCLNNGSAIPVTLPGGALVTVPVTYRYSYAPPYATSILIQNLPPSLSHTDLPKAVFENAGYFVNYPSTSSSHPPLPPPGHVTILSFRNGRTSGGGTNSSVLQITVLVHPEDPHLRHLPPRFFLPGWETAVLTLVEGGPTAKGSPSALQPVGKVSRL